MKRPRKVVRAVSDRERLAVARGQLRAFGRALKMMPPPVPYHEGEPLPASTVPRFVQVFTMQRGYYHALGALDSSGQLWERHQTVDKAEKKVTEEWWEKMPMVLR